MALSSVGEGELIRVGSLARPIVEQPFEYFKNEVDRVAHSVDSHQAFAGLSVRHFSALRVSTPRPGTTQLPRHLRSAETEYQILKQWAEDVLHTRMSKAFWALLDEHWPGKAFQRETMVKLAA